MGTAAAWAAGLNMALGLIDHWDRIDVFTDPAKLLSRDALHAILATSGALCMVSAVLIGGKRNHSTLGEAGTLLMGTAILFEW